MLTNTYFSERIYLYIIYMYRVSVDDRFLRLFENENLDIKMSRLQVFKCLKVDQLDYQKVAC